MAQQLTWRKVARLTKVDEVLRQVTGVLVAEEVDRAGEIFDYLTSLEHFKAWSAEFVKVTDGASVGNLRAMHQPIAAGKFISITYNDGEKQIEVVAEVVDENEWQKCVKGVYTGFSIGGTYQKKWPDPDHPGVTRYTAAPIEGSLVDYPCVPGAVFTAVKAAGEVEIRKFANDPTATAEGEGEIQEEGGSTGAGDVGKDVVVTLTGEDGAVEPPPDTPAQRLHDLLVALDAPCCCMPHRWSGEGLAPSPRMYVLQQAHLLTLELGAVCPPAPAREVDDYGYWAMLEEELGKLAKAGRTISGANMAHLQGIHDAAAKMGATCQTKKAEEGGETQRLQVEVGDPPVVEADPPAVEKAASEPPPWAAILEQMSAQLTEALAKVGQVEARMADVLSQPLPGGPLLTRAAAARVAPTPPGPGAAPVVTQGGETDEALLEQLAMYKQLRRQEHPSRYEQIDQQTTLIKLKLAGRGITVVD